MVLANLIWKIGIGKLLKQKKQLIFGVSADVHVSRQSTCSRWKHSGKDLLRTSPHCGTIITVTLSFTSLGSKKAIASILPETNILLKIMANDSLIE